MSVNHVDFIDTRLAAKIKPDANEIAVNNTPGLIERLNRLPIGDYAYLIIRLHWVREVVKYTHTEELKKSGGVIRLPVERGQHGTAITTFPAGACVYSEVTKAFLDEWIEDKR